MRQVLVNRVGSSTVSALVKVFVVIWNDMGILLFIFCPKIMVMMTTSKEDAKKAMDKAVSKLTEKSVSMLRTGSSGNKSFSNTHTNTNTGTR